MPSHQRRTVIGSLLAVGATAWPTAGVAKLSSRPRFNRAAYDRYIALMNAQDPRFLDCYAPDIQFPMGLHGKPAVLDFYARQWPFIEEKLEVTFFCADATGAAAQVLSQLRCLRDYDQTTPFGRPLKAGEVQRVKGCIFYRLNAQGLIAEISGPPPEVLQSWRQETR